MDYELEPEQPTDNSPAADERSTEHHESLLRAEAARASRANRLLGSLVVAGLAAATVVGVVTWQNASPGHDDGPAPVEEAAADGSLSPDGSSTTAGEDRHSSARTTPGTDDDGRGTGDDGTGRSSTLRNDRATPLTADQYAPPNAWSGDQFVTPGQYPQDEGDDTPQAPATDNGADADEPGDTRSTTAPEDAADGNGSSPDRPAITDLIPSIPGFPSIPGQGGTTESPDGTDGTEETESPEPTEPAEPAEPAEPSGSGETSPSPRPSEEAGERGDTPDTSSRGDGDSSGQTVTDTTGPTP